MSTVTLANLGCLHQNPLDMCNWANSRENLFKFSTICPGILQSESLRSLDFIALPVDLSATRQEFHENEQVSIVMGWSFPLQEISRYTLVAEQF